MLINYFDSDKGKEASCEPWFLWKALDPTNLKKYEIDEPSSLTYISYILGYSFEHLYLIVKTEQENLIKRDRAFQNGDGFHFVLAKPDKELACEFYVISVSPLDDLKFIWYRNIDFVAKKLENTTLNYIKHEGSFYFTVKVPWDEIEPMKPFTFKEYGFNLSYVQSVPKGKNIYILKDDMYIQSEQSLRKYVVHPFEKPKGVKDGQYIVDISLKHCEIGSEVSSSVYFSRNIEGNVDIKVTSEDHVLLEKSFQSTVGLNSIDTSFNSKNLKEGEHIINIWLNGEKIKEQELYLYKAYMFKLLNDEIAMLEGNDNQLFNESISTLEFDLENLKNTFESLKPYDSFNAIHTMKLKLIEKLEYVKKGENLFKQGEIIRMGFRSEQDNSLQPYSLYIPKSLEDGKSRLMVFLHGSGTDDTATLKNPTMARLAEKSKTILVAPFGRGTSHGYCPSEARKDIEEVTKRIAHMFDVKKEQITLGGFSMGGYGVLRVFDTYPSLYSKLLIVSGHHNLGTLWQLKDSVNYGLEESLEKFTDIPVVVMHGKQDKNCKFEDMEVFFETLIRVNKRSKIYIDNNEGHCGLTEKWLPIVKEYLLHDKS